MSLSPEEKMELVLASFRQETSIAELCRKAQVPQTTFNEWRTRFIEGGAAALHPVPRRGDSRLVELTRENERLKTVVADLSVENLVLKKGPTGAWSRGSK